MEAGNKALKCLVISNSQTFLKDISRILGSRRAHEVRSANDPANIKNLIFYQDLAILEDEYIHQTSETIVADLMSFLYASQIKVILFVDFKRKLPEFISKRTDFIRFISKAAGIYEIEFYLKEIEYRMRTSDATGRRNHDTYLEAIIRIQNLLLAKLSTDNKIRKVLKVIGGLTQANRVALFENKLDQKGKFLMTLRHEWIDSSLAEELTYPLFKIMPYQPNFNRWNMALSSGKAIAGYIEKLPGSEQSLLKTIALKNILLLPLQIGDMFWGFIMIANTGSEKYWREEELPYLKSIISPVASFFELKREEQNKRGTSEEFEAIFKDANIGWFLAGRDGNIKSCNKAFTEIIGQKGISPESLNLKTLTHPDDFPREVTMLKRLLDGEIKNYIIEKRLLDKTGNSIWIKLNLSAYKVQEGKPELLAGMVENIGGVKATEKALRESEEKYRLLTRVSAEGIVMHRKGVIIDCNNKMLEITGYSRAELVGYNLIDMLSHRDSADMLRSVLKSGEEKGVVVILETNSGARVQTEVESKYVDHQGERTGMLVFRDITDRRKTEQEIRRLNIAINQSPSSILIADVNGKIEYVNKAFCDISGYPKEELIGRYPSVLKSGYHTQAFYEHLWETITRGETWQGTFKNKTKDGDFFWERAIITPVFDELKNITHFIAVKENITQEKQTREALEDSEERHRVISDLTNDFVYSAVIRNNKIEFNWKSGSLEKLAGFELQEINEKAIGWYSIINESDLENVVFPAIMRLHREKVQNFEYRIKTKDHREKWVSDKLRLISDDQHTDKMLVIGAMQDITLRKSANIALDESKKYLDSIIDNLPIGLHIFDEKGYSTRTNETLRKLFGIVRPEELKGSFNILNNPSSKATGSDSVFREVYESKKTINREIEIPHPHDGDYEKYGRKVTISEIIFPILKQDGSVHSVISLSNDITQRVDAEKALRASELHQKTLLRLIPDLIFVLSEEGVFKDHYVEDTSKLYLGNENFIGKSFREVFSEPLSNLFYENLRRAVDSREMQSFKYDLEISGMTFYYETRLLVSKDNEVIAIIRDITESVVAEKSMMVNEEKFRELAERTQDTLILLSASNEILYVSPNLKQIIGISAEKYTENPLKVLRLIHPEDKKWVIPALNNYRKSNRESIDIQFRVVLETRLEKWIWYRENTIFDDDHKPLRYAAVMTDITANKMTEQQLKEAKEEAEKAYRSKSVFLANISHEIRTPMNAVLGFTDLLYARINDPVLKGYLNSIRSSGNTLLNLLNDILDLSKIEAQRMRIIHSPVNLFTVFEEIKHIFSLKALEKGLDYSFKIDKNIPPSLLLDELRLKQILLNLIDNAIKFTERGEITVRARIREPINLKQNEVNLELVVEDTGIGIPEHLLDYIFESFRQQDDQDKKKYKGTGLGLAITKRLVELFDGNITLESETGKGSRFVIILPRIRIAEPIVEKEMESKGIIGFAKGALKDKTILLVDEQKTNRDLIRELFAYSGGKLIEGETVEETLHSLEEEVDLCLIEMKSPGSVLEDLILLKNNELLKNSAKIGITTSGEFMLDPKVLAAFNHIITKPIQLEGFVESIHKIFQDFERKAKLREKDYDDEMVDFRILNEVIKMLKGELHKKWQSALTTSSFSEIERFAQEVKVVGTEYNLSALNSFSDVLTMHVKNFDIDRMNEVLNTYPAVIKELRGNLKNLTSDN